MNRRVKREICNRIKNILEVSIFLIVATWFWYGPREQMRKQSELVRESYAYMSGTNLVDDSDISVKGDKKRGKYKFILENNTDDKKDVIVTLVLDHERIQKDNCKLIANNKINYYLYQDLEEDFTQRTLSMDGNILMTTLEPNEKRSYTLEYFVDEKIKLSGRHFHAKGILNSGKNIV